MTTYRIKEAMAVPMPTGKNAEEMKANGIYMLQDMLSRMPNTTQKDMHSALEGVINSGASEFFKNMTPKTVISLPSIYILDNKDIFELDGKKYVTIAVDAPRIVGKAWKSPSGKDYAKGQEFKGEITALDLDSGLPVILPLDPIKDKITKPTESAEAIAQKANKEIAQYNEKIKSINKATGASKLVLQISRAKEQIDKRLQTLENIKSATQKQLENIQKSPLSAFESYTKDLLNQIQSGKLSLKDAYDTILYLNMSTPEKLISDIESGKIKIPEELKAGLLIIAKKEIEGKKQKNKEEEQKELEKQERIKSKEIPEIHDTEIEPFTSQDVPGSKEQYKEIRTPKSVWSQIASLKSSLAGSEQDTIELTQIKQSIESLEKFMGELEKGQRSNKFLLSPEGKPILDAMNEFLSKSSLFIKRYATDIIQDGKVNPKLMGTSGTEGNALLAVSLTRMYNVVKETIAMYSTDPIITEPTKEIPQLPQPSKPTIKEPIANTENQITKLSNALWSAFEDRMRPK